MNQPKRVAFANFFSKQSGAICVAWIESYFPRGNPYCCLGIKEMWLDLLIVISSVIGGFVCGRIYCAVGGYNIERTDRLLELELEEQKVHEMPSSEKVTEVAERLREHAESMAASVDQHQTKMQAVSNSLIENDHASTEDVLDVVNELIEANRTMQCDLNDAQERIHEQSMELESAERRALTDSLTRIANRRSFDMFVAEQHGKGYGHTTTLALLDVDYFKKFNDNHGHVAGDEVLRVVAGLLHSRLNQFGHVARYGGEEFAIVFDGVSQSDVQQLLESARVAISQRETEFENKVLRVTASIGVAQFDGEESVEEWIQRADAGLYQSKEAGRNCTHWMDGNDPILVTCTGHTNTSIDSSVDGHSNSSVLDSLNLVKDNDDQPVPEAFSGLPNKTELGESCCGILNRMESDEPMFVMAIRNHETGNEAAMKSLLPVLRSTLRTVDRIGYADPSTLLICMLSISEDAARERGTQICRSALAMAMASGSGATKPVTVGIIEALAGNNFGTTVSRAIGLAIQGLEDGNDAVCVEFQTAASL
jgi:diguanylate cyclase